MKPSGIAAIILAAGQGTRMKSRTPKVLHKIGGRTMLAHAMAAASALGPERLAVVIGDEAGDIADAARAERSDAVIVVQSPPLGTGDAVRKAESVLTGFSGAVLVLYADTPLVEFGTLAALAAEIKNCAVAVLGFRTLDAGDYGRIKLAADGSLDRIIEAKDASEDELELEFANSGVMAIGSEFLARALPRLKNNNAKGEFYLTDVVAIARDMKLGAAVVETFEDEVMGVNSRAELAIAEIAFQDRRRAHAMAEGVTLIDPATVYFSWDTKIGADTVVEPNVWFGPGVSIAERARIRAFCHIEGAEIGPDCSVGPFARLRPGARLLSKAAVGDFVEVKNAEIGAGAKAPHLAYIGDASVGAGANIGAGVITCNYDGVKKHRTEIGADAFIGSNAALVAPVKIGDGAYIGSGSVITKDVEAGDLAVARGRQTEIKGWAARRKGEK